MMNILVRMRAQDRSLPTKAVIRGLRGLGHCVELRQSNDLSGDFDALVVWNGLKSHFRPTTDWFHARGLPIVFLERGFFDRMNYTQIDTEGFNHAASWRHGLMEPAPEEGRQRLAMVGAEPKDMCPRDGYVLVLGQTPGDWQVRNSTMRSPQGMAELVAAHSSPGMAVQVRTHPQHHMPRNWNLAEKLLKGTLEEALAGAAFAVTVNSNAGNDALLAGVPVLAFGPALYIDAGVVGRTSAETLRHDLEVMAAGFCPASGAVENYLRHLACRQFSRDELAGEINRLLGGSQ